MQNIRKIILQRLHEKQWSQYRLWQELDGKISEPQINQYLRGDKDMSGERLQKIFDVLELRVEHAE